MVLVGVLGSAPSAAQEAAKAPVQSLEEQYKNQEGKIKKLEEKEKWLAGVFGKHFQPRAGELKAVLGRELAKTRRESRTDLKNVVDAGEGPEETKETLEPVLSDLEGKEGSLPSQVLRDILKQTYPRGWVDNEVSIIEQKTDFSEDEAAEEAAQARKDYETKSKAPVTRGKFVMENGMGKVTLYPAVKGTAVKEIVEGDVAHEVLGHGNDWDSDNEMSADERADLLHAIYGRLSAPDRFRSSYVEGIQISDPQKRDYYKAKEYYAEVVAQFFKDADKLSDTDYDIIKWRVEKTDPKFNWKEAKQRRDQLFNQALRQQDHAVRSARR